ncbi:GGDEF domain-containing protein [Natronospira proteinivora]|uniref:GGDEF domain-containing protein n=1 Tax=Natronospira proteinivora TaxID=1807133 RepID=A0ABT1G8Q3_9GAMM|nr:PAS domain-containing protein [Natronospira proteinivora]MCP1727699.1 GGDEF domain-containing protein [Natronospira proteinivora]
MNKENSILTELGSELFTALWREYPDNLFLIRVSPACEFYVEAVNPTLQDRFSVPDGALNGRLIDDIHPPEVSKDIKAHYRDCLLAGRAIQYEEVSRSPVAEGEVFETILMPIHDAAGDIRHILGISRAITRLRRAEQALRQSNQDLEARLERRQNEIRQLREQLQRAAIHDGLTGCYRRDLFMEIGARELRRRVSEDEGQTVMVVVMDGVEDMKVQLGVPASDAMVSTAARLFQEFLEPMELLAHEGEGVFLLLLHRPFEQAQHLRDQLLDGLSELQPEWRGRTVALTARTGMVEVDAGGRNSLEELVEQAKTV